MPNSVGVFRDGNLWTVVRPQRDGKLQVVARVKSVLLEVVHFSVSAEGRKQFLNQGRLVPSHAMVVGDIARTKPVGEMELLAYEPETMDSYHISGERYPIRHAQFAFCDERGKVWAV